MQLFPAFHTRSCRGPHRGTHLQSRTRGQHLTQGRDLALKSGYPSGQPGKFLRRGCSRLQYGWMLNTFAHGNYSIVIYIKKISR